MRNKLLFLLCTIIFAHQVSAQNSRISWSSTSAGFGVSSSDNTVITAIIGEPLVNSTGSSNTSITSGFLVGAVSGIATSVIESIDQQSVIYELHQNYPNPFNPTTTIRFGIPETGFVSLKIYDLLGREVASLIHEELSAGRYDVVWDAAGIASGIYIYSLKAGGLQTNKKLILLK